MKIAIKKTILITILAIGVLIYPISTIALSVERHYDSIDKVATITNKNLDITDVTFINDASTIVEPTFGLIGTIKNKNTFPQRVSLTASFYNKDYHLIAEDTKEVSLVDDLPTTYSHMLTYDKLITGATVTDIKYFTVTIKETTPVIKPPINKIHEQALYSTYPYLIDTYDIKINVNENNTYDITETITTFFNEERHGIFRKIPTVNRVNRLDGTTTTNFARVSKVKVNEPYTTSQTSDDYEIKIGSRDRTITGEKKYKISYHYSIGQDQSKEYDEVYLNLIGPEWDTAIGYVSFEITMPKDFEPKQIGFSSGKVGSTENDSIIWERDGNKIYGTYQKTLEPHQALTFRLELEEGYFEISSLLKGLDYLIFFIPLVCLVICISIWNKYGKDDKVVEVINFYPPEGLNSIDIALRYKGEVTDENISSLLVYLANKGYIKITEEKFDKYSYGDFSIKKIKDYDGTNKHEKQFLEGLFQCKKKSKYAISKLSDREKELNEDPDVVTSNDLKYKFSTTVGKISRNINGKRSTNKIIIKGTNKHNSLIILLMIITYLTAIAIPTYMYSSWKMVGISLLIGAFYLPFFMCCLSAKTPRIFQIVLIIFMSIHISAVFLALPLSTAITTNILYASSTIFSVICLIGMVICLNNMPKRTPYGIEILGQIKGFKTFLETAEKSKLEELVEENPNYFYDILPYTYVLGISRKWINKFESILLKEPDWYTGTSTFNVASFGRSINRTVASASSTISSGTSSGTSSSSGGGSSGGGSGGGGGGSW